MDDNLGRLFSYLEKEGLMDNTVIMYTGDQGFFLGEHDMQDKRWAYEPSLRMPLIVSYPQRIPANTRSDAIIENIDFPATMLDFAGLDTPNYMQGKSFRSILETGKEPVNWKKAAYYQYWMHMAHHDVPGHIAMRTKRYKLIQFYGTAGDIGYRSERSKHATPAAWELYDLQVDPTESNNLYDVQEYRSIREKLKKQFKELRVKVQANLINQEFSDKVKERITSVNKAIKNNWSYNTASKKQAELNSKLYLEKFGNPKTTEPYIVPWLRPGNLDPSEM